MTYSYVVKIGKNNIFVLKLTYRRIYMNITLLFFIIVTSCVLCEVWAEVEEAAGKALDV